MIVVDDAARDDDAAVTPPVDSGAPPRDVAQPPIDRPSGADVVAPRDDVVTPRADVVEPVDLGSPVDTGPEPSLPLTAAQRASLPVLDGATVARVREIRAAGAARGMRANVFAKIGDSITESGSFLFDIGEGWGDLGGYTALQATVSFFRAQSIGGRNSFNRASVCATAGWTAARALEGDPSSPLRNELAATRPAYAVVMYGTNDIDMATPDILQTNLTRIAQILEDNGTVPILSTIPDRTDRSAAGALALTMNQRIRAIAAARHIPLMDFWAALQPLPAKGMDGDGIHPNVYRNNGDPQAGDFTSAGLRFGYNTRNLVTVLALDRVRAVQ
ncbi:MAG: SGNH/GDSL hydrolase family protein [Polyangiales bacterium]